MRVRVYVCVCITCTLHVHPFSIQLKNMINALFSSRPEGSKQFQLEVTLFGWQTIVDLYQRECKRRSVGAARMVPKLREVYVLRDSWTKLNVHPAKIMQVRIDTLCSI